MLIHIYMAWGLLFRLSKNCLGLPSWSPYHEDDGILESILEPSMCANPHMIVEHDVPPKPEPLSLLVAEWITLTHFGLYICVL